MCTADAQQHTFAVARLQMIRWVGYAALDLAAARALAVKLCASAAVRPAARAFTTIAAGANGSFICKANLVSKQSSVLKTDNTPFTAC